MLKFTNFFYKGSKDPHKGLNIKIKHHVTKSDMQAVVIGMVKANIHLCHDSPSEQFKNLHIIRSKFNKRSIEAELRSTLHSCGHNRLDFGGWDGYNDEEDDKLGNAFVDLVLFEVFDL